MSHPAVLDIVKMRITNRNGFTFLMALFVIVIVGILSAFTGKSWTMMMKREREKELIYRGSQIKEAIENWYNPRYTVPGVQPRARIQPLMDLKDLLQDPNSLTPIRYLPHNYASELDDKNTRCAPDCAKLRVYQDPMTGKEWTIIRGTVGTNRTVTPLTGTQGAIIGVASKSEDTPFKTDFSGTSLENMGSVTVATVSGGAGSAPPPATAPGATVNGQGTPVPGVGDKMTKYSEWRFIVDPNNDHAKLYRSYHEGW